MAHKPYVFHCCFNALIYFVIVNGILMFHTNWKSPIILKYPIPVIIEYESGVFMGAVPATIFIVGFNYVAH